MTLTEIGEQIKKCRKCPLANGRNNAVPGEGNPQAEILFCGEGPGREEDKQGRPFVGAAGKLLTTLIDSIGLKREDVFIGNVVKCRPPGNRDPLPEEIETCTSNWLGKQIDLIKPKLIVILGRHSLNYFLPSQKISQAHGHTFSRKMPWGKQVFFVLYHPAAALYRPEVKGDLEKDFKKIPKVLDKADQLLKEAVEEEKENSKKQAKLEL